MTDNDATQAFLDSLPEVDPDEEFRFACHPDVACFNACCADLNLVLTPYDALRLRLALGLSSEEFLKERCAVSQYPDTGFPALHLRMLDEPGRPCPFVTDQGCGVYPHRPGACRTYPIGRATRLNPDNNVVEQFFLVREPHCLGFEQDKTFTVRTWTHDQGLEPYNRANDRYVRLMARQKGAGAPIAPRLATMVLLALFQLDRFRDFIRDMRLFDRLELSGAEQERILADDESLLDFAFDWVELAAYGENARLKPKDRP